MNSYNRYLVLTLLLAGLWSCGSVDDPQEETSTLVFYKIDYTTFEFEGGLGYTLTRIPPPFLDEIPLEIDKELPDMDDDGFIRIFYAPTLERLFQAELNNTGASNIIFPNFIDPSGFFELDQPLSLPSNINIESIDGDHSQVDITPIWNSISNLGLTEAVLDENTVLGLYLYQPNAGPEHSENWDWILMLYQQ